MFESSHKSVAEIHSVAGQDPGILDGPVLSPTRALGLLGGFYLLQFVAATVVGAVAGLSFALQRSQLGATGPGELVGIVGPLGSVLGFGFAGVATFYMARRHSWAGSETPPWAGLAWKLPGSQVLLYAAAGCLLGLIYLQSISLGRGPGGEEGGVLAQMGSTPGWPRIAWAVLALLLAPWIEEFIFRGVLFGAIAERLGGLSAGALVALLFSFAHLPETLHFPPAILAIAALALLLSAARWQSRGLLAPVAVHGGYNAVIVSAALWFG